MVYDSGTPGNGVWHCPFPPSWVERMKRAAKHCETLTEAQIEATLNCNVYVVPSGDFLSEEQDTRGLPLSWCIEEERRYSRHPTCCTAIYDYDSIPELVVTDGNDDWPLTSRARVLTA